MSHDHCDCVEGLEEHIAWQSAQLAEQDARGLRLAGENESLRAENEAQRDLLAAYRLGNDRLAARAIDKLRAIAANRNALAEEEVIAEDISPR